MSLDLPGPLLLLGATGLLGQAVRRAAGQRSLQVIGVARSGAAELQLDLTDAAAVEAAFDRCRPSLVINAAAETNLEACERDPGRAYLINARLPGLVASLSQRHAARFVQVSTDHYHRGDGNRLHAESEPVRLLNEYARTKYAGEAFALTAPGTLIVRTNIVGFRGWQGRPTFVEWALGALRSQATFSAFEDMWTSSIDVHAFAEHLFGLVDRGAVGIVNLAAREASSKLEFIRLLARRAGLDDSHAVPASVHGVSGIPRADSLGLDVTRAETLLGRRMPGTAEVVDALWNSI